MQNFLTLCLVALSLATAGAQVTAEIVLDQEQFLRSESMPLRVRISNFSGQTLKMAQQPDWLVFQVEGEDGKRLDLVSDLPAQKPFELESSKTVAVRADLMQYFDLSRPGRYQITARVKFPQLDRDVATDVKRVDVVTGTDLWKREVGVPGQTPPEVRQYVLQVANFKNRNQLYARITDSFGKPIRVQLLGPVMSFSANTIEAQVDGSSNLHVLFQNYKDTFIYSVIAPDGEQMIRQTHEITSGSRPHLRIEEESRIHVAGGQRRILLSDLPPARVANTNEVVDRK